MISILILLYTLHCCKGVIYKLNDTDYALMPPVFHMDPYEECFDDPEGLYCTAEFTLVSDEPSPLLNMIQEYSAHIIHYNHTLLRRGICITKTCKTLIEVSKGDLRSSLEACVNESLYDKYKLRARVLNGYDCSKRDRVPPIDSADVTVAIVCTALFILNIVACISDTFFKRKDEGALRYLHCFSIQRNWKKLVAPAAEGQEPRLRAMRGLHGIRVLNMALVIAVHSLLKLILMIRNPEFVESVYKFKPFHLILSGTPIMQTFLMISSLLLVYNSLIYAEKHKLTWKTLPTQFLLRWLRLTPSYAVVLALTATWFARLGSGPYWQTLIGNEMADCRQNWWRNVLYINNYYNSAECMGHSWYLAADTQLYYMASIVFVMCTNLRTRKLVLSVLFVIGVIAPILHVYFQNLRGIHVVVPENSLNHFLTDPTFNKLYKRGHTNIVGTIVGMVVAYMVYDWQKAGGDPKSFRKYRYLYWTLFPMGCLCCYCGGIYYEDNPPPSLYVNMLYAGLTKPIFAVIVGTGIAGLIIEFEDLYRSILQWRGWTIPSRLSFCAYLLHVPIMKSRLAMQTAVTTSSVLNIVTTVTLLIVTSYTAGVFLWILVETPFSNLIREYFGKSIQEEDKEIKRKQDIKDLTSNEGVVKKTK